MCGITGFISENMDPAILSICIDKMSSELRHRGPDQGNTWVDKDLGLALGHRRLSVLDLSDAGSQPMISSCGRLVIVYNGEIYNHPEIRNKLKKEHINWRGTSDTETLIEAIRVYGLEETLQLANGMFAFALWDRKEQLLSLCRDRVGEKPLYYGFQKGLFLFASELKPLIRHPGCVPEINGEALQKLFQFGYIPEPLSILKDVYKVPPASVIQFHYPSFSLLPPEQYWKAEEIVSNGLNHPFIGINEQEKVRMLERILSGSVKKRMISDVPVGAFLSGGFDSGIVTALMQRYSSKPVKTFSIGFEDPEFDESGYASAISGYLGTDHTGYTVTTEDCLEVIPELPGLYDEPFADSSQIPAYILSALARKQVTVALSGDGGDELFAGYNRHFSGQELWNIMKQFPAPVRKGFGKVTAYFPFSFQKKMASLFVQGADQIPHLEEKMRKLSRMLQCKTGREAMMSLVHFADELVVSGEWSAINQTNSAFMDQLEDIHFLMYHDLVQTLPGDMLVKVDRASMGNSLEVRMPFLDPELIEFSWKLPLEDKMNRGEGKKIVKKLGYQLLPEELLDHPKKGFEVPVGRWLRTGLKDWAHDLLQSDRIKRDGYLNPEIVQQYLHNHEKGTGNYKNELWAFLMFQSWLDTYREYLVK